MCLSRFAFLERSSKSFLEGIAQGLCHLVSSTFSVILQDGLDGIDEIDEALLF